jgi:hypothetical protein
MQSIPGFSIWQKKTAKYLDSEPVQLFLMALLMLSLFLADSWVLGNSPDHTNDALYGILTAIFVIFMCETITLCVVQDKYFGSFFFLMDLVGNLSIILYMAGFNIHFFRPAAVEVDDLFLERHELRS